MEYVSVRVGTLRGDQKIDFDVFVKINDKMILYLRRGDSLEGDRLNRLKSKKLKKVFIHSPEETLYLSYLKRNIEMAFDEASGKSMADRTAIIHGAQQATVEDLFEYPDSEVIYAKAKEETGRYIEFLKRYDTAVSSVIDIDNKETVLSHHCVNVATLSIALATKLGGIDDKKMLLLAMGALLHDMGHHEAPLEVNKSLKHFSKEELRTFKDHAGRGVQRLQGQSHFDHIVQNIMLQHEEKANGRGFPKGLIEKQTDPLSVIVATANAFDRKLTYEGVARADVAKQIMIQHVGEHPLTQIQILSTIFNKVS